MTGQTMVSWRALPVAPGILPEGARWISSANVFQWVDILQRRIHRWNPDSCSSVATRDLDLEFVTVAIPLDSDRSIVASRSSLHEFSWERGTLCTLVSSDFPSDIRFNDGGIAPDGTVVVGTMSMEGRTSAGSLFRLSGGALTEILTGVGISNGIGWDSESRCYYVDSVRPQVNRLEANGDRVRLCDWVKLPEACEPDGLTVLNDEAILVADWGGQRLLMIETTSQAITEVKVPGRFPTSVALGGAENDVLVVTTAQGNLDDVGHADGLVFYATWPLVRNDVGLSGLVG